MSIKVSVIVPVYNVEKYLDECLCSLVRQTLQEIEIIVVNDGSPDESQKIIDYYAEKYPTKIVAFTKENGGLSDARNFGIKHARGEYIAFVDSDDFVDYDMFELLYKKGNLENADIVCSPITSLYCDHIDKVFFNRNINFFGKSVRESPAIIFHALSIACNKIYKLDFWKKEQFEFPVGRWFEDSALIYNVLLMANKIEAVDIPFYHYRQQRDGAITHSVDERIFDIFKSCESVLEFYRTQNAFESHKNELANLCVRHIFARFTVLKNAGKLSFKRAFVNRAFSFLDMYFDNWKRCSWLERGRGSLKGRALYSLRVSKTSMLLYLSLPRWIQIKGAKIFELPRKFKTLILVKPRQKSIELKSNKQKQVFVQKNGLSIISEVQDILANIGITCFVDFGSLLGIIREQKLLAHDTDIDLGVITTNREDSVRLKLALERRLFKLWRQYFYNDMVVEESYRYKSVKIDINYYQMADSYAQTYLFYRNPGQKYPKNTRNIVRMRYSSFNEFEKIDLLGHIITIPKNYELLLKEKYGPTWRIPDKGWVYWESPAAKKLDEIGTFMTCRYSGSYNRAAVEELIARSSIRVSFAAIDKINAKLALAHDSIDTVLSSNNVIVQNQQNNEQKNNEIEEILSYLWQSECHKIAAYYNELLLLGNKLDLAKKELGLLNFKIGLGEKAGAIKSADTRPLRKLAEAHENVKESKNISVQSNGWKSTDESLHPLAGKTPINKNFRKVEDIAYLMYRKHFGTGVNNEAHFYHEKLDSANIELDFIQDELDKAYALLDKEGLV